MEVADSYKERLAEVEDEKGYLQRKLEAKEGKRSLFAWPKLFWRRASHEKRGELAVREFDPPQEPQSHTPKKQKPLSPQTEAQQHRDDVYRMLRDEYDIDADVEDPDGDE